MTEARAIIDAAMSERELATIFEEMLLRGGWGFYHPHDARRSQTTLDYVGLARARVLGRTEDAAGAALAGSLGEGSVRAHVFHQRAKNGRRRTAGSGADGVHLATVRPSNHCPRPVRGRSAGAVITEPLVVTSTAFQRAIGDLFARILTEQRSILITMHDRPALVMLPSAEYDAYRRAIVDRDAATRLAEVTL